MMINFAAYLGLREIHIEVSDDEGRCRTQRLSLDRARRDLVSLYAPKTTALQSLMLDLPAGRHRIKLTVLDTPGIAEGISDDPAARHQLACTMERLLTAAVIFHVVDASAVGSRRPEAVGAFDAALMEFGRQREAYLVVANKMDKPGSHEGLRLFRDRYKHIPLIPVSSITRRGFRDLKVWMVRTLA